jgi:hypothetical protein
LFSGDSRKTTKNRPLFSSLENSSHEGVFGSIGKRGKRGDNNRYIPGKVRGVFDKAKKRLSLE